MSEYRVVQTITQTVYVEANSEQEAIKKADFNGYYATPYVESDITATKI